MLYSKIPHPYLTPNTALFYGVLKAPHPFRGLVLSVAASQGIVAEARHSDHIFALNLNKSTLFTRIS